MRRDDDTGHGRVLAGQPRVVRRIVFGELAVLVEFVHVLAEIINRAGIVLCEIIQRHFLQRAVHKNPVLHAKRINLLTGHLEVLVNLRLQGALHAGFLAVFRTFDDVPFQLRQRQIQVVNIARMAELHARQNFFGAGSPLFAGGVSGIVVFDFDQFAVFLHHDVQHVAFLVLHRGFINRLTVHVVAFRFTIHGLTRRAAIGQHGGAHRFRHVHPFQFGSRPAGDGQGDAERRGHQIGGNFHRARFGVVLFKGDGPPLNFLEYN